MQTRFTENAWIKIAIVIALTSLGLTYIITTNGGRINICVDDNNISIEIESSMSLELIERSDTYMLKEAQEINQLKFHNY